MNPLVECIFMDNAKLVIQLEAFELTASKLAKALGACAQDGLNSKEVDFL